MFAAVLLRFGLAAAIGVVAGLFVYHQYNEQQERAHSYERGHGREWRSSDYREPHDSWSGPSTSRARSNSSVRRRRKEGAGDADRDEWCSQKMTLTNELCAGVAECSICVELIDAQEQVYPCKKCFNIFHLPCIRKWADQCISNNGTHWTCPNCKYQTMQTPRPSCLCGQTAKPISSPGRTPHCCSKNCSRCNKPCHPGACD
uniref:RING-type domain-containing protein n=1 Tax=Lygus hesperus TaxID=30085 RepID=A0A0A9Y838_LYGHE